MYAALTPGNVALTTAAQQLAAFQAPYLQGLNTNTALQSTGQVGQLNAAIDRAAATTALQSGLAGAYQSALIENEGLAAKTRTMTELMGPSTAASLANTYGLVAGQIQRDVLQGESNTINATSLAQAELGRQAADRRNESVSRLASTNMDIRKEQERTKNALTLQRGQIEGQLALGRAAAGRALSGAKMFA